jgi:hypothetical protein
MSATLSSTSSHDDLLGAIFAGSANPPRVWSMVTAYFDESGTHHGARVSAVAGFTATDPEWSSFSIQWRGCLHRHGISGPFHMSEFESRKGEFSELTDEQRLSLISSLAEIIVKHDVTGFAICVERSKFHSLVGNPKRYGKAADPYYLLLMTAMAHTVLGHAAVWPGEKLLFVFDRKPNFVQLSNLAFDSMLKVHPWVKEIVSDQVVFASREAQAPLQAADMLAYETYKRALDPSRAQRKLFSALRPAFDSITKFTDEDLAALSFEGMLAEARQHRKMKQPK